jgi:nucleotide-binding universal stress UspA family protein
MTSMILCPTRGGASSRLNQEKAIALARERDAELLFLYVSNVQFLGLLASPVVVDIETELDEMGEFLLTIAQERAEKAGVHAGTLVKRGVFHKVLKDIIQEYPVKTVVLGRSQESSSLITPEYAEALGQEISQETGVEFIVVQDGEIAAIYKPQGNSPSRPS